MQSAVCTRAPSGQPYVASFPLTLACALATLRLACDFDNPDWPRFYGPSDYRSEEWQKEEKAEALIEKMEQIH